MWATIYTDATFNKTKGAAGAYYIRSNHTRLKGSFKISECSDSNVAEVITIAKAIERALEVHNLINITLIGVHVVTDSGAAIAAYKFKAKDSKNASIRKWQLYIQNLLLTHKIRIKLRHIKGHQKVTDVRTYLNNELDKLAKETNGKAERNTT